MAAGEPCSAAPCTACPLFPRSHGGPREHQEIGFPSRLSWSPRTWAPSFLLSFELELGVNLSKQVIIRASPPSPSHFSLPSWPLILTYCPLGQKDRQTVARTVLGSQLRGEWRSKEPHSPMNIRSSSSSAASCWVSRLSLNWEHITRGSRGRHVSLPLIFTPLLTADITGSGASTLPEVVPGRGGQEQVAEGIVDMRVCELAPPQLHQQRPPGISLPNPTLTNNPLSLHSQTPSPGMSPGDPNGHPNFGCALLPAFRVYCVETGAFEMKSITLIEKGKDNIKSSMFILAIFSSDLFKKKHFLKIRHSAQLCFPQ